MPLLIEPTRSESTKREYKRRTKELARRCRKELSIHTHEILDLRRFVGWLITNKTIWARTTWRQYKASVVYSLEQEIEQSNDPVAQEALELLLPEDVEGCIPVSTRTSGIKLKKFPIKDFNIIHKYLKENQGIWNEPLRRWLVSGLLTGLRPQEWANTEYTVKLGEDALIVKNAKHTNGRGHGPTRTILLGGLTEEERETIKEHVKVAQMWEQHQQYARFYQACAATLGRISRKLFPKKSQHVSFYSARHQFAADAKASGVSREEIAALMGHAVDETASIHYGRKTAGYSPCRVRPDPEEVYRIRNTFNNRFIGENEIKPDPRNLPKYVPNDEK